MRLPAIPVGAGKRLTNADIVITVHNTVSLRDHEVLAMDRPRFVAGYNRSYMGLLSLEDVDIESMKSSARKWSKGKKRFAFRDVVATDDIIDVVTQLCEAGAVMSDATVPSGLRIPKLDSHADVMEKVELVAAQCPELLTCTEETAVYKAWHLSIKGSQQVEMLHSRVDPTPLFDLPEVLPCIENMSTYSLILYLEDRCGFVWCQMPRKKQDRASISFRPADPATPRFWCSGGAWVDHMYLRALATAVGSEGNIVEVLHGERHSWYLELLGISVEKKQKQQLSLDDGEADFPNPKRTRETPALEDGDIEEPAEEDQDVDHALVDLDFEEALAAELELAGITEDVNDLDEHIDGDDGDDGAAAVDQDKEREDAAANPSEHNHQWGPFGFTLKRSKASGALSWECRCRFHRRNFHSGCKKTMVVSTDTGLSFAAESDRVLDCLRHWANQALLCNRQRMHLAIPVLPGDEPPKEVISAQMITLPKPKQQDVQTDMQLDGHEDDDGSSSSQ